MGKKLTVYLIDGTDTGSRTIEIGNWSGKALHSPRANLNKIIEREDFKKPGVYILKSDPNNDVYDEKVYIGESENIGQRIKQHLADSNKDFKEIIAFISKDELLTKSHIKYIESRLVALAKDAKNSEIENGNTPTESTLSEADISDMEYFIDQIKIILPVVGYYFLVPSILTFSFENNSLNTNTSKIKKYFITTGNIKAEMIETDDGFIVSKGSTAKKDTQKSMNSGVMKLKNKFIETGILVENDNKYLFTQNTIFSSLSAAATLIYGSQTSGTTAWKDESGKTYKEILENIN